MVVVLRCNRRHWGRMLKGARDYHRLGRREMLLLVMMLMMMMVMDLLMLGRRRRLMMLGKGRRGRWRLLRWWWGRLQRFFRSLGFRWSGQREILGLLGGSGDNRFLYSFVQDAYGTVLSNSVRDFPRVDPHRQFRREEGPKKRDSQPHHEACPCNQWIHLAVDSDTTIPRTLERLVWEPVVGIMPLQEFRHIVSEPLQLVVGQRGGIIQTHQINEELGRRTYLYSHIRVAT